MSLLKKNRNDAVKAAVTSYLERRNYPDIDVFHNTSSLSQSAEQMAVATIVQCEASRANSILFSCINNDPAQYDLQYTRLVNFIKEIKQEHVKNELLGLLSPLLCHLYLEILRGGHGGAAQMFLKRHSATLPQKDLSYHQPIDGNLPSALYRPNSLEQLFNSLQNGTIDNETPEKDYMNQILDDIVTVYTLQEVETRPSIAAFRSCKYDVGLSQESLNMLKSYLAKHGHVLLMQVLQTWFHIDMNNDAKNKKKDNNNDGDEEDDQMDDDMNLSEPSINSGDNHVDTNVTDIFSKCNGHSDYQSSSVDKELRELQEAIKGVRETIAPLKLYKIAAPDSHLICAKTDQDCSILAGGFSNSEIHLWELGRGGGRLGAGAAGGALLAAGPDLDPADLPDNTLPVGGGVVLRGHSGPVTALGVLSREQLVLSCSRDCSLRAWRLADRSPVATYRGHNYPIWCMDVSKNGLFIVTGSHDRTAKLWSLDRTFPVRIFVGHTADVTCVKFHPNEAYVGTGGADRSVRLWTVCDARLVRVLAAPGHAGHAHRAPIRALAFAPAGNYLASAGDDKKIKVWDIAACTCIHEYRVHGKVTSLDWSAAAGAGGGGGAGDALLVAGGMDGAVKLMWDNQVKSKSPSGQDVMSTTYNTKCSYVVDVQVHPNWVVAIGTKR